MLHFWFWGYSSTPFIILHTVSPLLSGSQITGFPLYPAYNSYSLFFLPDSNIRHVWVEYHGFWSSTHLCLSNSKLQHLQQQYNCNSSLFLPLVTSHIAIDLKIKWSSKCKGNIFNDCVCIGLWTLVEQTVRVI